MKVASEPPNTLKKIQIQFERGRAAFRASIARTERTKLKYLVEELRLEAQLLPPIKRSRHKPDPVDSPHEVFYRKTIRLVQEYERILSEEPSKETALTIFELSKINPGKFTNFHISARKAIETAIALVPDSEREEIRMLAISDFSLTAENHLNEGNKGKRDFIYESRFDFLAATSLFEQIAQLAINEDQKRYYYEKAFFAAIEFETDAILIAQRLERALAHSDPDTCEQMKKIAIKIMFLDAQKWSNSDEIEEGANRLMLVLRYLSTATNYRTAHSEQTSMNSSSAIAREIVSLMSDEPIQNYCEKQATLLDAVIHVRKVIDGTELLDPTKVRKVKLVFGFTDQ